MTNYATLRDRIGAKNHDEYIQALGQAQGFLTQATAVTDIKKARKALDEATSRIWVAEKRLKDALTGMVR